MLKSWLVKKQYVVETATSVAEAKRLLKESPFDMILSDIRMPETDGFAFLSWIKKYDSDIIVILMTGFADIDTAVESIKLGAVDYISKPIDPEVFYTKVSNAFKDHHKKVERRDFFNSYIKPPGKIYEELSEKLQDIIQNNRHLLIIGAPGSGKVSIARYVYEKGRHSYNGFVSFDSDLYVNGDYDPKEHSPLMEKFLSAKGGLFFVRKIHKLNIQSQNELLALLTNQNKDENFTQIIASTEITHDELRKKLIPKLFQTLEKDYVVLPVLKDNRDSIMFYANHFLELANNELDKSIQNMDDTVVNHLVEYNWPGNIQELKNTIIKAALLTDGHIISADLLPSLFKNQKVESVNSDPEKDIIGLRKENYEKAKITEALELAKGNKTMAASILNIDRKTLYNKIKLYKVEVP